MVEGAVREIIQHVHRQNAFNESVRASFTSLAEQVNKHQSNFTEVVQVLKAHEEFIVNTGTAYQQMAQCINSLVQTSENNTVWISSVMRETQEQTQVLRQHELGLRVQAEVIKSVVNQQQQQQQQETATRTVPTVEELDDNNQTGPGFQNGPSPQTGPPDKLAFGVVIQVPQVPMNMEVTPVF